MEEPRETFFAPCPRGLEWILTEELEALGASHLRVKQGGVEFVGPFSLVYRVNLESRLASRVLWRVFIGPYRHVDDVYEAVRALPWFDWFSLGRTIKVKVVAQGCRLRSLDFVALRVKDAICDAFLARCRARPSVEKRTPDVQIVVYLDQCRQTVYLDTSGEPLFKRGWRQKGSPAPLRENLAAGILRLARWTPEEVLVDPLCGSGTFLIEAAYLAVSRAPGRGRGFAFEKFHVCDPAQWRVIREESLDQERSKAVAAIYGCDRDRRAIEMAKANARGAGVESIVSLRRIDVLTMTPPAREGVLVMNPPYGHRLGDGARLARWYPCLGDRLKQYFWGWRAYVLTADRRFPTLIRLDPRRKIPLFNGSLECRLYEFHLVQGRYRRGCKGAQDSRNSGEIRPVPTDLGMGEERSSPCLAEGTLP